MHEYFIPPVGVCSLTPANGQWKTVSDAILVHFILLTSICCMAWESSTLSAKFPFSLQQRNLYPHMSTHDNSVCIRTMYVYMSVIRGIYFRDVVKATVATFPISLSLSHTYAHTLHLSPDGVLISGPQGTRPLPALSLNTLSICADSILVYCIVNSLYSHFSDIFQCLESGGKV